MEGSDHCREDQKRTDDRCSLCCFYGTDLPEKVEVVTSVEEFTALLKNCFHWGIAFDRENNILICNQRNSCCFCFDEDDDQETGKAAESFCHGALIEQIFEAGLKRAVKAEVITSLRNGGRSCVFRVFLPVLTDHETDVFDRA